MYARRIVRLFRVSGTARDAHALWRNHARLAADISATSGIGCAAQQIGPRTQWQCLTPGRPVFWETHVTADVPGRLLTWSSLAHEPVHQQWDFWFAERADGHGTDVRLVLDLVSNVTDGSAMDRRDVALDGGATATEDPIFAVDPEGLVDHLIQQWQWQLAAAH